METDAINELAGSMILDNKSNNPSSVMLLPNIHKQPIIRSALKLNPKFVDKNITETIGRLK